jgi:hypothetical protein
MALTNSVVDYLVSIADTTKLASAHPGKEPFLVIRGDHDEEDSESRHRATFLMVVEVVDGAKHAYFLVHAQSEMRHGGWNDQEDEAGEGDQEDIIEDWVETESFITRHELGLYGRER